jgi:hypothetical protein
MSAAATEIQAQTATLAETVIKQHCKQLHLPAIAGQCARLAEQAEREHHSYLGYLDVLLQAELVLNVNYFCRRRRLDLPIG